MLGATDEEQLRAVAEIAEDRRDGRARALVRGVVLTIEPAELPDDLVEHHHLSA